MAGLNIHMAIANEYLKKHRINNEIEFQKGNIYPDMCIDKGKSHYSGPINKNNLVISLNNKVNLKEFLINTNLDNDFNKGIFLHLITDYLFYNYFFDKEYLKSSTWNSFENDLFYSFDITDSYIKDKYNVEYNVYKDKIINDFKKYESYKYPKDTKNIININKLDNFIDEVSSIDLEKKKQDILNNNSKI